MKKQNCWEFFKCGHELTLSRETATCPVATSFEHSGVNGGLAAGRICWVVKVTNCSVHRGEQFKTCMNCPFFAKVIAEEGREFTLSVKGGL